MATDVAISARYRPAAMREWLRKAMDHVNISQAELARKMSVELGKPIDRAAVNKMLAKKGKLRQISAEEMIAISKITGFAVPETDGVEETGVRLVGYVGAGAEATFFAEGDSPGERVAAPEDATESTVAVEIRGTSLGELFDRWLVFYDDVKEPITTDLIGRLCVCGLEDGRVLVKKLKRGQLQDHWTLLSNTEAPMYDQAVRWAARVRQMMPR